MNVSEPFVGGGDKNNRKGGEKMSTDISLYKFVEILESKNMDPEQCKWITYVGDSRFLYHAVVGKNGMPKEITKKLKKQGFNTGDVVLLVVDN